MTNDCLRCLKYDAYAYDRIRIMVFNATFNNISVISGCSVLLVEEYQSTQRKPLNDWKVP